MLTVLTRTAPLLIMIVILLLSPSQSLIAAGLTESPGLDLELSAHEVTLYAGSEVRVAVRVDGPANAELSVSGLTPWLTAVLERTSNSSVLTLRANRSAPTVNVTLTIEARMGEIRANTVLSVSVKGYPDTSGQLLGTFFYPWYGNSSDGYRHWRNAHHAPPRTWAANYLPDVFPGLYDPSSELYDSRDYSVFKWQMELMRRAGIQFVVSSWWGPGRFEDLAFRKIITDYVERSDNPYPTLLWTIYYEKEGYSDPSVEEIKSDIEYVLSNYASSPNFLRVDGKPVIFVYGDGGDTAGYVARWSRVREELGIYVVLKVFGGYRDYAERVDSWHQYAPAKRYEAQAPYSAFVSPGFWKYHESPRLVRDPAEFEEAVRRLSSLPYKWLLVQTWNEYHEGTQVEPAQLVRHIHSSGFAPSDSYGSIYIDILARYFGEKG